VVLVVEVVYSIQLPRHIFLAQLVSNGPELWS